MELRLTKASSFLAEKRAFSHAALEIESLLNLCTLAKNVSSRHSFSSDRLIGSPPHFKQLMSSIFNEQIPHPNLSPAKQSNFPLSPTDEFLLSVDDMSKKMGSFVKNHTYNEDELVKLSPDFLIKINNNLKERHFTALSEQSSPLEHAHNMFVTIPIACAASIPSLTYKYINSAKSLLKPRVNAPSGKDDFAMLKNFCAGAGAGVVSRSSTAPLERLKILYQVNYDGTSSTPNMFTGLRQIYIQDGVSGFFRGNLTSVLRATPFSAIRFSIFEQMKKVLSKGKKEGEHLGKCDIFVAGAIAGLFANLAIYPMEVVRVRLTASPTGTYNGISDAFMKIARTEGRVLPFFKGATACLCSSMPNTGINLMVYESLKRLFIKDSESHLAISMGIGAVSSLVASTLLFPFSALSSRLIMQKSKQGSVKTLVQNIYQKEGFRGFYKGYMPGIAKIVIGNGISFAAYEWMKTKLH